MKNKKITTTTTKEYCRGLPGPPGDLPGPGIESKSFMPLALAGGFFTTSTIWEAQYIHLSQVKRLLMQLPPFTYKKPD